MIGVDTNVLARLLVTDNEQQHGIAVRFFAARTADDPAFISVVVQAELVWLLIQTLRFPAVKVVEVLRAILLSADFVVEQREILEDAIASSTPTRFDLADFLITGLGRRAGCQRVVTFDKPAARNIPGMELLK